MKQRLKIALCMRKYAKLTDHHIHWLFLSSCFGIILCMVCLAGTTWAWFTAGVQTQPQNIKTADYAITVLIKDASNQPMEKTESGYSFSANCEYAITLSATGTASSGGYCRVEGGGKTLYSAKLLPGETLSFTLIPFEAADYVFTSVWGSYSGEPDISNNCVIGEKRDIQPVAEASESRQNDADRQHLHIVQAEDTLWGIAAQYDTTVEKIAAYNDIAQDAVLQIGQEIKIPPQDYEILSAALSVASPDKSSSMPQTAPGSQEGESAETGADSE